MIINDEKIIADLRAIAKGNGGKLMPKDVVDYARPKKSPLHHRFTWDNDAAAEKWRLHQARGIINVLVEYIDKDKENKEPVQVFVALRSEIKDGGGYRVTTSVMSDDEMRADLLAQALEDMRTFQKKYRHLSELASVFEAIDNIQVNVT